MAPHSPFPGLPITVESRAPLLPLTRPYAQLLSGSRLAPNEEHSPLRSDFKPSPSPSINSIAKHPTPTFTPHLPGRSHRTRYTGLSSLVFFVLLVMLIGGSGAVYRYQTLNGGRRQQSMVDIVKVAYFERDVIPSTPVSISIPMLEQREESPTDIPAPTSSATSSELSSASATSSRAAPRPSTSKATFRNGDDVRDPSAVKPDEGENNQPVDPDSDDDGPAPSDRPRTSASASVMPDSPAQPTTPPSPAKRHWSSRIGGRTLTDDSDGGTGSESRRMGVRL